MSIVGELFVVWINYLNFPSIFGHGDKPGHVTREMYGMECTAHVRCHNRQLRIRDDKK